MVVAVDVGQSNLSSWQGPLRFHRTERPHWRSALNLVFSEPPPSWVSNSYPRDLKKNLRRLR
jgi:hypothetical protein